MAVSHYTQAVQTWIDSFIVTHNICPFARKEVLANAIHYHVTESADIETIMRELIVECERLSDNDAISTSIIILPQLENSFDYYLDVLELANQVLFEQGYEGVYQIASFHPKYIFADSDESDPANYSNRAPYPLFHLIREDMLEAVLKHVTDPDAIPENNIQLLRSMAIDVLEANLQSIKQRGQTEE